MFPPWPSRKILVLQHHNLKKLPLSMSQWISWGTIPHQIYDAYCIVILLGEILGSNQWYQPRSWFWHHAFSSNVTPEAEMKTQQRSCNGSKKRISWEARKSEQQIIWRIMKKNHRTGSNMNKSSDTQKKMEFFFGVLFFFWRVCQEWDEFYSRIVCFVFYKKGIRKNIFYR